MICNPPYFYKGFPVENEKRKLARHAEYLQPEVLINAFINRSTKNGILSLILPVEEGEKFILNCTAANIFCIRKTIVYSKPNRSPIRLLLEFSKLNSEIIITELIIENEAQHNYTEAYKALTKDFYLKF
jgi:tRNA1Val (adenine37-N6)-methyltransferase